MCKSCVELPIAFSLNLSSSSRPLGCPHPSMAAGCGFAPRSLPLWSLGSSCWNLTATQLGPQTALPYLPGCSLGSLLHEPAGHGIALKPTESANKPRQHAGLRSPRLGSPPRGSSGANNELRKAGAAPHLSVPPASRCAPPGPLRTSPLRTVGARGRPPAAVPEPPAASPRDEARRAGAAAVPPCPPHLPPSPARPSTGTDRCRPRCRR